jgi:hypothetical protein
MEGSVKAALNTRRKALRESHDGQFVKAGTGGLSLAQG